MSDRSICACCGMETTNPAGWSNPNCISDICCCVNCVLEHKNRYHCICGSCLTHYEDTGCTNCNPIKDTINRFTVSLNELGDYTHNQNPREYLGPPK